MSFLASRAMCVAFALLGALLWVFGALRFLCWFMFRQWHIPKDKLAATLELDSTILAVLPWQLRNWYSGRQFSRRRQTERREFMDTTAYMP